MDDRVTAESKEWWQCLTCKGATTNGAIAEAHAKNNKGHCVEHRVNGRMMARIIYLSKEKGQ